MFRHRNKSGEMLDTITRSAVVHGEPTTPREVGRLLLSRGKYAEAERTLRQAIVTGPSDDGSVRIERAAAAALLCMLLSKRYQRGHHPPVLAEWLGFARMAVKVLPPSHEECVVAVSSLGEATKHQYLQTGNSAMLEEAVEMFRQIAAGMPGDNPRASMVLSAICELLTIHGAETQDLEALDAAIEAGRASVETARRAMIDYPAGEITLATAFLNRCNLSRERADLDKALSLLWTVSMGRPRRDPSHVLAELNLKVAGKLMESLASTG